MNIFVTGSNGYIGSNFLNKASSRGYKIFALTRKKKNKKIKNVQWLVGSIEKKWKELEKTDVLVHLATYGGYERFPKFKDCYNFNFLKSKKLIQNAYNFGCRKLLIIGSKKEKRFKSLKFDSKKIKNYEKKPDFIYPFSKALFTNFCLKFSKKNKDVKCRIIRLFHVYGKNENKKRLWPSLINAAKKDKNFQMSVAEQKTDFNYIDNIIDGLINALNFDLKKRYFPQIWEMGSGKTMSVKKFAKLIWNKLNPSSKIIFSKIKNYDKKSFKIKKDNHWKISYTSPALTVKRLNK